MPEAATLQTHNKTEKLMFPEQNFPDSKSVINCSRGNEKRENIISIRNDYRMAIHLAT
jgi:hypothetical protein